MTFKASDGTAIEYRPLTEIEVHEASRQPNAIASTVRLLGMAVTQPTVGDFLLRLPQADIQGLVEAITAASAVAVYGDAVEAIKAGKATLQ